MSTKPIPTVEKFDEIMGLLGVPDSLRSNFIDSISRLPSKITPEGLLAIAKDIRDAQPPQGYPYGANLANFLAEIQFQSTMDSFNISDNGLGSEASRLSPMNLLNLNIKDSQSFVRLTLPPKMSMDQVRSLAGYIYRPVLGFFITEIAIHEDPQSDSNYDIVTLRFDLKKRFDYRLSLISVAIAFQAISEIHSVEIKSADELWLFVEPVYHPILDNKHTHLAGKYFLALLCTRIKKLAVSAFPNARRTEINMFKRTITVFGKGMFLTLFTPEFHEMVGDDVISSMFTSDIEDYQSVFGLIFAKQMHAQLFSENCPGIDSQYVMQFLNILYCTGRFVRNNNKNILEMSKNVVDSLSDRYVERTITKNSGFGSVSNTDTVSTSLIVGNLPKIGTGEVEVSLKPLDKVPIRDTEISMRRCPRVGRPLIMFETITMRLFDIVSATTRSEIQMSKREELDIATLIEIAPITMSFAISVDLRTPARKHLRDVVLRSNILPMERHTIVVQLFNKSNNRGSTIDLKASTLSIRGCPGSGWKFV